MSEHKSKSASKLTNRARQYSCSDKKLIDMNVNNDQSDRYVELQVFRFKGHSDLMELAKLEPIKTILIPQEIYQEGFIVVQNKGDSMEKLIMDGASVVVDTTSCEIVSGSIYALSIPWEGCILRECHSEPHGVLLRP